MGIYLFQFHWLDYLFDVPTHFNGQFLQGQSELRKKRIPQKCSNKVSRPITFNKSFLKANVDSNQFSKNKIYSKKPH